MNDVVCFASIQTKNKKEYARHATYNNTNNTYIIQKKYDKK